LDDTYYHDPTTEVLKAQQWFKEGYYGEVIEQLKMFSQPPINDHAASIISKITDYIN
jgi:hypothetical protein